MGPRTGRTAKDARRGAGVDEKTSKARLGDDSGRREYGETWAHMLNNNIGQKEINNRREGEAEEAKEEGTI